MTLPVDVLVVAAHPDDEILGCAGRIAKHADAGDRVHILILAEGSTSRSKSRNAKTHAASIDRLRRAARKAAKTLGAASVSFGGLPDNRMDGCELLDVVKLVERHVTKIEPAIVYTHHGGDLNIDHRIAHQAVVTACRPLPECRARTVLTFETLSSTEWADPACTPVFAPTVFIDISAQWDRKCAALEAYSAEMREFPHARSVRALDALAQLRGSACGRERAEAFALVRMVID